VIRGSVRASKAVTIRDTGAAFMRYRRIIREVLLQSAVIVALALTIALFVNHMREGGIPLVADWSPAARLQATSGADDLIVAMSQAIASHQTGEAIFVDARPTDQFADGHISGAINVPWEEVYDHIERIFMAVPGYDALVIAYCDGEACALSEELVLLLRDLGYSNAKVLINGWTLWRSHGYPIEDRKQS
jgi:rhodanese-related sulfurtransferase